MLMSLAFLAILFLMVWTICMLIREAFPVQWKRLVQSQVGQVVVNAAASNETTISGILGLLVLVLGQIRFLFDADPATTPDWTAIVSAVMFAIGLWRAKDKNKTGITK